MITATSETILKGGDLVTMFCRNTHHEEIRHMFAASGSQNNNTT